MPHNPFFVGGPVPAEFFVGRTIEANIAFDQLSSRSHLALYGSSGMGKSSFLRFLASPQTWEDRGRDPAESIIVYLNCTDINPFTPTGFWREVLRLLQDKTEEDETLQTEIANILQQNLVEKADLRRILRKIGQRQKFVVLLLDDYDAALVPNPDYTETEMLTFLSEFRNLAVHSDESQYLSTVVTTFRRLNELGPRLTPSGSPWYNHYLFQSLKPFNETEINALFVLPVTLEVREGVREVANGHPALLQNAGYLIYNALRSGQEIDAQSFAKNFLRATEHIFRDAWALSTPVEQMLLMLIALAELEGRLNRKRQYNLGNLDIIFSQRGRELDDLEERGLIHHRIIQGKDVYWFASSLMEWWVIQEIENSTEADLEQREKVFLNLMSREQVERIRAVIRQVWQHKDAIHSVAGWLGKLVGAFAQGIVPK